MAQAESVWETLGVAVLRCLPPETAHGLGIKLLARGMAGPGRALRVDDPVLKTCLPHSGLVCSNPVGLAAGFDKDAQAVAALSGRGFGFIECGTVTPFPQAGHPRPRVFRLGRHGAIINRLGFPGQGLDAFVERLQSLSPAQRVCLGANIGANADSEDRIGDYIACAKRLAGMVAYLAVNISSPNTQGLRDLQRPKELAALLERLDTVMQTHRGTPVFLKLSPDIEDEDVRPLVALARQARCVSGLIVSNTTIARPEGLGARGAEAGGLSGKPLFERSTQVLRLVAQAAAGELDLIGTGGVSDAETAYAKIRAGAHAVQLYTALVYAGASLVEEIKRTLAERLKQDGFNSVQDAVGADL